MTTRICGAWLGFPWISSILGDFMWISWIPKVSGAPGLMTGTACTRALAKREEGLGGGGANIELHR